MNSHGAHTVDITNPLSKHINDQQGVVLILVALFLVVLLGITALSVDIGYLMAARNEAQNVADAAALAAAGELGEQYYNDTEPIDEAEIRAVAREIAGKNAIAKKAIGINDSDIEIGFWHETSEDSGNFAFYLNDPDTDCPPNSKNSVRVTVRRDENENGAINTFFATVLGNDTFTVSANATAALSCAIKAPPGDLIPVGISKYWFDSVWEDGISDQPIKFYPTGNIEGCAAWDVFDNPKKFNTNTLRTIIDGMADGSFQSPETIIGSEFEFGGGTVAAAFSNFEALYNLNKDATTDKWETRVVIYDRDDCSNPSGSITIVGFATAVIRGVYGPPTKEIDATVSRANDSRGEGGVYGTFGKIPNLVE